LLKISNKKCKNIDLDIQNLKKNIEKSSGFTLILVPAGWSGDLLCFFALCRKTIQNHDLSKFSKAHRGQKLLKCFNPLDIIVLNHESSFENVVSFDCCLIFTQIFSLKSWHA
jgi:hypothetical protein